MRGENLGAVQPLLSLAERVCLEEYGIIALDKLQATSVLVTYLHHTNSRVRRLVAEALGDKSNLDMRRG